MTQENFIFEYQRTHRFFAQIADGTEEFGAEELSELGAKDIHTSYRGIYFGADKTTLYRINYCSRLIARVLAPLHAFQCHSDRYLYRRAGQIHWPDLLKPHQSFAVSSNDSNSKIKNSQYAGLRLKDAIVDQFSDAGLKRPNIDRLHGISLFWKKGYDRSYRTETTHEEAPFQRRTGREIDPV